VLQVESWTLWKWLLLYDKELGRDANKGHEILSLWLGTKGSIYVFMSYLVHMLSRKKWMKGGHPMESTSHGLRIEKRVGEHMPWSNNSWIKDWCWGVLINETVSWYHVLWWKCSASQLEIKSEPVVELRTYLVPAGVWYRGPWRVLLSSFTSWLPIRNRQLVSRWLSH
jgi:hypothetical protein